MPANRPVSLIGTVTEDARFRPIPGGGGVAYITLTAELNSAAPGAPAQTSTVDIQCSAALGSVADYMFDEVKRGWRVVVQGSPLVNPPTGPGPRQRQFNTLLVEPLPV